MLAHVTFSCIERNFENLHLEPTRGMSALIEKKRVMGEGNIGHWLALRGSDVRFCEICVCANMCSHMLKKYLATNRSHGCYKEQLLIHTTRLVSVFSKPLPTFL
jgi:hypothetical protein